MPLLQLGMRLALGEHVVIDGPVPCEQIAYRFYREPPISATKVLGINGLNHLGERPGVLQIDVQKEVGDPVDWRTVRWTRSSRSPERSTDYTELAEHYAACTADSYVTYEHETS